jgi:hypothetical protein
VKAFGLGEVARLQQPISRPMGVVWLAAALAFVASAVLLVVARRQFWVAALPAVVLSQVAILASWSDAKLGTIANAVVLVPLALSMLDLRASSLRSRYDREVRQAIARAAPAPAPPPIAEAELAPLPPLVQTWLRRAGVVGKPRVRNFHAVFRAEMRFGPDAKWMPATVEQYNFYDPPARLFFMEASRLGVPFDAFHRYVGPFATFEVRLAGLVGIVDARGPEMDQSETVTMLNDICFLAPAALVGAPVTWEPVDARRVRATFTNAGHTVSAVLSFDGQGDLVGFVSGDRYQSDGKTHRLLPWSTPLGDFRDFGGVRLPGEGEARWQEPRGEWTYGRFLLQRIDYNVTRVPGPGV